MGQCCLDFSYLYAVFFSWIPIGSTYKILPYNEQDHIIHFKFCWKGRSHFRCSYTHTHTKGHKEIFGGDENVYYFDVVVMVSPAYVYVQAHQIVIYVTNVQIMV